MLYLADRDYFRLIDAGRVRYGVYSYGIEYEVLDTFTGMLKDHLTQIKKAVVVMQKNIRGYQARSKNKKNKHGLFSQSRSSILSQAFGALKEYSEKKEPSNGCDSEEYSSVLRKK